jgi:2-polyprenyl-3-methyl-5-hydroxy-6-metoxy-1,4-benzoquinol methylase
MEETKDGFVLDCSVTMAWCFDNEATPIDRTVPSRFNAGSFDGRGSWRPRIPRESGPGRMNGAQSMTEALEIETKQRATPAFDDCYFYHSMSLPGHGEVKGQWDLRGREKEYLGQVDLAGKKVFEIGTASGHLCFWMESQGADVLAYDLSPEQDWDIVPYHNFDYSEHIAQRKDHIQKLNNAWWFARERFQSNARVIYGSVYELSPRIGRFDVVTMGSILLHLRDPFLAIQKAASLSTDTLIITDVLQLTEDQAAATVFGQGRVGRFRPDAATCWPYETWWELSPHFVAQAVQILGFTDVQSSVHRHRFINLDMELYTIVARRDPHGIPRYNEAICNQKILQNFNADDYLLSHLSPRRAGIVEAEQKHAALLGEKVEWMEELARRAERIEELEKELAEIAGSRSWRLTGRLSRLGQRVLPKGSGRRRVLGSGYRGIRSLYHDTRLG